MSAPLSPPRWVDRGLALSLGVGALRAAQHGGAPGLLAAALQVGVALGFWLREPQRRSAGVTELAAALPSLLTAALLLRAAGAASWPAPTVAVAAAGAAVALGGMASLRGSFAVLPGVRTLRTGGLYRLVRHPVYLGEGLVAGAAASRLGSLGLLGVAVLVPTLVWRIRVEERLLAGESAWREWAGRVRWRLMPGIW